MTSMVVAFWMTYLGVALAAAACRGATLDELMIISLGCFCVWGTLAAPASVKHKDLGAWHSVPRMKGVNLLLGLMIGATVAFLAICIVLILNSAGGFWTTRLGEHIVYFIGAGIGILVMWGVVQHEGRKRG